MHSFKESDEQVGLIEVDGKESNEAEQEDAEEEVGVGSRSQSTSDKKTDETLGNWFLLVFCSYF